MREIKFRAWDGEKIVPLKSWDFVMCPISESKLPIMQYTGLLDKNGKEIYEGDILRWRDSRNLEVKWGRVGWVLRGDLFKDFSHPEIGECSEFNTSGYIPHSEIIGNRFENPELLDNEVVQL